jgi:predicted nucleic acid-binding protein
MTFADLAHGAAVFLDANIFVYHFEPHQQFGPPCTDLLKRIELGEFTGYTSTHVVSEVAHRLMTIEAATVFHWLSKVVKHLKQDAAKIQQLTTFHAAIQKIPQMGVKVLTIPADLVDTAAGISRQVGLFSNDALIVAVTRANGLTNIATEDADFDRVPGITRYAPV